MKTIALRPLIASSFIAMTVVSSPCAGADANPAAVKPAAQAAAERKADLVLWQRSGAAELFDAASYDASLVAQYRSAHERYSQWRNGAEFAVELQKLGVMKTVSKTD